jgi:hypothetical protein
MIVDVHAHGLSEKFIIAAANDPRGWRVELAAPRRSIAADYVRWIRLSLIRRGRRRLRTSPGRHRARDRPVHHCSHTAQPCWPCDCGWLNRRLSNKAGIG